MNYLCMKSSFCTHSYLCFLLSIVIILADPPSSPTLRIVSTTSNSIVLSWQTQGIEDETPATGLSKSMI